MSISNCLDKNKFPVVVTGMGQLSSLGQSVPKFRHSLLTGESNFIKSCHFPMLSFSVVAALLQDFNFENALTAFHHLPDNLLMSAKKMGRRAPLTIQASLISALEAWEQAKLHERSFDKTRFGIVVAGNNTTQNYQYINHTASDLDYLSPSYALRFMDTDQIGTLSEVFGIEGEGLTVGGASASGNVAIIQAYKMIKSGFADICLVVGVLADLSPFELQSFYSIGALGGRNFSNQPSKACRPFDKDREGFIWGQASGCLVLESALITKAHGIPVIGEISGIGFALDANHSANPSIEGEKRAMRQALDYAKCSPTDIQYLNTHGTSSILGDETEISAINSVFEENKYNLWLNSTKSFLGHCLWSAGIMETISTFIQMQDSFVHANLNLDNPIDAQSQWVGTNSKNVMIQKAMSNSFGFGGINTSLVLTKIL